MIANERILEVVCRLMGVPSEERIRGRRPDAPRVASADRLDINGRVADLEEEFGQETVGWAVRYIEALAERPGIDRSSGREPMRLSPNGTHPLWDRDLDR